MQNPIDLINELKTDVTALPGKIERDVKAFALRKMADAFTEAADLLRQQANEVEAGK